MSAVGKNHNYVNYMFYFGFKEVHLLCILLDYDAPKDMLSLRMPSVNPHSKESKC